MLLPCDDKLLAFAEDLNLLVGPTDVLSARAAFLLIWDFIWVVTAPPVVDV